MLTKIKLSLFLMFFSTAVFAQISDAVLDSIANQTCLCLKEKNNNTTTDRKKFQMIVGLCIIESYRKNENLVAEKDRVSISDSDGLGKIGELVGMKMVLYCPDFILKLSEMSDEESNSNEENTTKKSIFNPIEGVLLDIKTEQFVTFVFKDNKSKIHTILLLDYFDTAHLFRENQIKKNDKIRINYIEHEMYDPQIKDFRNFKVMDYLEKIN